MAVGGAAPLTTVLHRWGKHMPKRSKAVAFDLDATSLFSLREALPDWEIEVVRGATADSLAVDWNPGATDLLVVKAREKVAETIGLCRFLVFLRCLLERLPAWAGGNLGTAQERSDPAAASGRSAFRFGALGAGVPREGTVTGRRR